MEKIQLDSLVIEVTRRCQLKCEHCLRGNAQKRDMSRDYIKDLFKKVGYISNLTFTGGEPSLVPHIIQMIRKKQNITKYV